MLHDVLFMHRRNICNISRAYIYYTYVYCRHGATENAHSNECHLSNYRLNRCRPLRCRFNERVVTWKLCVVTPMFTIGVVAVHFPWKRTTIQKLRALEESVAVLPKELLLPRFHEGQCIEINSKNNFLTWFFTFSEPENNLDINFITLLSNVIFNTLF